MVQLVRVLKNELPFSDTVPIRTSETDKNIEFLRVADVINLLKSSNSLILTDDIGYILYKKDHVEFI